MGSTGCCLTGIPARLRLLLRRRTIPFLAQAVRQGFQDMGVRGIPAAHAALAGGATRLEARSGAAQAEGNIHDMHSYSKVRW